MLITVELMRIFKSHLVHKRDDLPALLLVVIAVAWFLEDGDDLRHAHQLVLVPLFVVGRELR